MSANKWANRKHRALATILTFTFLLANFGQATAVDERSQTEADLSQRLFQAVSTAGRPNFEKEADKAVFIIKTMANYDFRLPPGTLRTQFCTDFLEAFKNQQKIEHIDPVARSDPYKQEVFTPYLGQCSSLNLSLAIEEDRHGSRLYSFGPREAQLFLGEYNNNPEDGQEVLFRSSGFVDLGYGVSPSQNGIDAHRSWLNEITTNWEKTLLEYTAINSTKFNNRFFLVDLDRCEVNTPFSHSANNGEINGLIKYMKKFYIYEYKFDLEGIGEQRIILNALEDAQYVADSHSKAAPSEICYFR